MTDNSRPPGIKRFRPSPSFTQSRSHPLFFLADDGEFVVEVALVCFTRLLPPGERPPTTDDATTSQSRVHPISFQTSHVWGEQMGTLEKNTYTVTIGLALRNTHLLERRRSLAGRPRGGRRGGRGGGGWRPLTGLLRARGCRLDTPGTRPRSTLSTRRQRVHTVGPPSARCPSIGFRRRPARLPRGKPGP